MVAQSFCIWPIGWKSVAEADGTRLQVPRLKQSPRACARSGETYEAQAAEYQGGAPRMRGSRSYALSAPPPAFVSGALHFLAFPTLGGDLHGILATDARAC